MTLRVALCYANRPEIGQSNLGLVRVQRRLSEMGDCEVELRFLQKKKRNQRRLTYYDLVIFSLPFEGDYPGMVQMLLDGEISPLARHRGRGPFVLAGGFAPTLNPEPIAELVDAVAIGDAEPILDTLASGWFELLRSGLDRRALVEALYDTPGIYLPSRYCFDFDATGSIDGLRARDGGAAPVVYRQFAKTLDQGAQSPGSVEIFAGCTIVEASRGCLWSCRFCAAGFAQRPYRERPHAALLDDVRHAAGQARRVGLVGADIGDLSGLREVVQVVHEAGATVTPAALRASAIDESLARALAASGKKTATLAPEAGSEDLRRLINKHFGEDEILRAVERLAAAGVESIKLYFLLGLPQERDVDVDAIADLALRCRDRLMEEARRHGRVGRVLLSVTPFVPKPATPFQWQPFCDEPTLRRRSRALKKKLRRQDNMEIKIDAIAGAREQAIVARGDRRLGEVLIASVQQRRSLTELLRDREDLCRGGLHGFAPNAIFPWQAVEHGSGRDYLWREWRRAQGNKLTPACNLQKCTACELRCGDLSTGNP